MRAAKVDANQAKIVAALRKAGASVQILSAVGQGCPDILTGFQGRNILMEIKDGEKTQSAQKLTPDQVIWHRDWQGQVIIVRSVDESLNALKEKS
jgi:lambda repressor-like predicted transcriptional regulator